MLVMPSQSPRSHTIQLTRKSCAPTSAFAPRPDVPAVELDVDPAVHVAPRVILVIDKGAVHPQHKPVPFPASQDGACVGHKVKGEGDREKEFKKDESAVC